MRGRYILCALMLTAVFAAGCTSTSAWKNNAAPGIVDRKAEAASQQAAAEKKESPFVPERQKSTAKIAERTADKHEEPHTPGSRATSKDGTTLAFSPEILKLIDDELKDATLEERSQWYEQLKRVEPGVIPEILRARRMSLQLAQTNASGKVSDTENVVASRGAVDGFSSAPGTSSVKSAAYKPPGESRPQVNQTGGSTDSPADASHVTLQGFEPEPANAVSLPASPPPIAVQRQPPATDARNAAFSEPATPAVPWPPQKVPSSAPPKQNLAQAIGAGLVQNVVGLVPTRGSSSPGVQAANAVQTPAPSTADATWESELQRAISQLEQEIATQKPGPLSDDDLQEHVALRLMYLLAGHQERALTAIPGLDSAEQEFWQQAIWGISNSLDAKHMPRPEDRATQTISQFNAAIRRLQEKADLQIRNVAFSKQNFGYGNYDRFLQNEVRPGQEVLLYAEVENFKSEPTADGQYRTLLRSTIEILSPSGEVRKKIDFPATEDVCRNYRRDYFHNYQFTVPDRLPLGPHVLKIAVFDELSGKMATYSVNFLVN